MQQENNDFQKIIACLFHSRNQTHIYHWQTNSFAQFKID